MKWWEIIFYHKIFSGHDDGVLRGKTRKIEDKFKKPISIVFQNLLKSGKINGKKNALQFCDNYLTFDQVRTNNDKI